MGEITRDGAGKTMGLDLGDRFSQLCMLDERGEVCEECRIATTARAMRKRFEGMTRCLVVIEVGSHSPWVQRLLEELGHEVMVTQMETCSRAARLGGRALAGAGTAVETWARPRAGVPISGCPWQTTEAVLLVMGCGGARRGQQLAGEP